MKSSPDILTKKILQLLEEAIRNVDYANSICWVFGITSDDIPNQNALFLKLLKYHEEYQELSLQIRAAKKRRNSLSVLNLEENFTKFEKIVNNTRDTKDIWKNGPVKILCSVMQLLDIALEVKKKGFVSLDKAEIEKSFDFSGVISFWDRIPSYTLFLLGGGISVSSPEFDLFQAMAWAFNEATKTSQEMSAYKNQIGTSDIDITVYGDKVGLHSIMCRQTLINAFLLVEAFINSVSEASLIDETKNFTEKQRLFLRERVKDRNGQERQNFVSIEDKLYEWTKIISPTGKTFNKGNKPFQDFMKIKKFRDATVHLAAPKVKSFRAVDFKVASKAARVTLEMIKLISEYTSSDSNNIEYPFWFTEPHADGLFHVSRTLTLQLKERPKI